MLRQKKSLPDGKLVFNILVQIHRCLPFGMHMMVMYM